MHTMILSYVDFGEYIARKIYFMLSFYQFSHVKLPNDQA